MTPKGTTNGQRGQWRYFERGIVCIHIGKVSLVKYSIERPHEGRRTGKVVWEAGRSIKKKREAICKLKRVGTSGDEKDSEEDEGGGRGQEGWGQNYKQDMATANGFSPV
jgi:hypothetical protein